MHQPFSDCSTIYIAPLNDNHAKLLIPWCDHKNSATKDTTLKISCLPTCYYIALPTPPWYWSPPSKSTYKCVILTTKYLQLKDEPCRMLSKLTLPQALASLASQRSSNRWRSSMEQAFRTRRRGPTSSWSTRTSSWPCSPWSEPWTYSRSSMRTPLVRYVEETDIILNRENAHIWSNSNTAITL